MTDPAPPPAFPLLPPMPEPARRELTARLLQSILEVFGGGVVAVLGKGSCFKGDFLPGYSDFDLHVFLDPARAPMLGPRAPALDRTVAFQRAIGPIRAEDYGAGALQISFVDAVDYPDDWTPPLPGTFTVLHGALPDRLPEPAPEAIRAQAQAFFPWLRRDLRAHLQRIADMPDTRLAGAVRLFGTSVKPALYHAAVLLGEPPLEVWARPLGNVLPIVEPAWCPSRGLSRFFGDALHWAEVKSDPERLRAMFAAGWQALDELCAAAAAG